jgi:hypothetical protein
VSLVMLWVGHAHRSHRIGWLARIADSLGEKFHRPSWVGLPVLVFTTSIICALFGFIWDVSWHIGNGRDPGPLANPAHYFIVIGLFGVFLAGMLAIVLPFDKPSPDLLTFPWVGFHAARPGSGGQSPPRVSRAMAMSASGL